MHPFDLQTALQHPNWVRHVDGTRATKVEYLPERNINYPVRIEWSDGVTGTYPEDSDLLGMEYPKTCRWANENSPYDTECGNLFEFIDGTPSENGFKFCPFCGKEIST